ncbi:hypothetical protein V8C86DRAFT_2518421 [Haematococcus lacustris]
MAQSSTLSIFPLASSLVSSLVSTLALPLASSPCLTIQRLTQLWTQALKVPGSPVSHHHAKVALEGHVARGRADAGSHTDFSRYTAAYRGSLKSTAPSIMADMRGSEPKSDMWAVLLPQVRPGSTRSNRPSRPAAALTLTLTGVRPATKPQSSATWGGYTEVGTWLQLHPGLVCEPLREGFGLLGLAQRHRRGRRL